MDEIYYDIIDLLKQLIATPSVSRDEKSCCRQNRIFPACQRHPAATAWQQRVVCVRFFQSAESDIVAQFPHRHSSCRRRMEPRPVYAGGNRRTALRIGQQRCRRRARQPACRISALVAKASTLQFAVSCLVRRRSKREKRH